jgi:hypothetical protein
MATKPKRVTYNDAVDDNADYLVPLQYDTNQSLPSRPKSSRKAPPPRRRPTGFLDSIYFPILLVLYAGVPLSQFLIGLININQCTIRQFIPIYMILSGFFGLVFVAVGLILYMIIIKQSSSDDTTSQPMSVKILYPICILLFMSVVGWWLVGQVIVFGVKIRVELFDPTLPEYCPENLYKAAYILIFVDYIIALIAIILNIPTSMSSPSAQHNKQRPRGPTRK